MSAPAKRKTKVPARTTRQRHDKQLGVPASKKVLKIVQLTPQPGVSLDQQPFAGLVALLRGEAMEDETRPCLYIFKAADGIYEYADGMLAVEKERSTFILKQPLPELWNALRLTPSQYKGLVAVKKRQTARAKLVLLVEAACGPIMSPASECHGALALLLLKHWNKWTSNGIWKELYEEVWEDKPVNDPGGVKKDKIVNLLQTRCRRYHLKKGRHVNWDNAYKELQGQWKKAYAVFQEFRRRFPSVRSKGGIRFA